MAVKQQTSVRRGLRTGSAAPAIAPSATDWAASKLVTNLLEHLPGSAPRFVARAPGRLDVMGGIGEYTGSLVLNTPIAHHACAAVSQRADQTVSILVVGPAQRDGGPAVTLALTRLVGADGAVIDANTGRALVESVSAEGIRCVLGVLVEMLRARLLGDPGGGLSVVVGSTLDQVSDAGADAALAAAVLVAVAEAFDVKVESVPAAVVCQRVLNDWLDLPVGPADAVIALIGESHTLTQLRCDPCAPAGNLRLPDDLVVMGIDSAVRHPDTRQRFVRARTTAFMGRLLIDRIIQHEGKRDQHWDGYLARISVTDYVEMFRDRIPTKLRGSEFLDRFGETGDPLTRIDPDHLYRVRSRTEHHIYEHARAAAFAECISRALRRTDERALTEAGELMYASHWSYGQRCGLGSVETDLLVTLLRHHGTDGDLFGVRITGQGCGGVLVALMRATDRTHAVVEAALTDYKTRTGRTAQLLRGALPGALVAGARSM